MPLLKKRTPDKKRKGLFNKLFRTNKTKKGAFAGSIGAGVAAIRKRKKRLEDLEKKMGR